MILKTENLRKKYKSIYAINDLNINIEEGSIYALLGLNGAGKSTTLGILSTLIKPNSGNVSICGFDLKSKDRIRSIIGLQPQDSLLPQDWTLLEILNYYAKLKDLSSNDLQKEVQNIIDILHLDSFKNKKVKNMSHGMQKLVNVAQAFLGNPKLVMLDEPLSGLDPKYRHKVRQLILSFKGKTTILISTHLLEEVELFCTHVGILHNGKIKVETTTDSIKKKMNVMVFNLINPKKSFVSALKKIKNVEFVKLEDTILTVKSKVDNFPTIIRKLLSLKADIQSMNKGMKTEDLFLETVSED